MLREREGKRGGEERMRREERGVVGRVEVDMRKGEERRCMVTCA